jgi:hypothetical protein
MASKALPTFEQAGRFALAVGCKNEQDWQEFTKGMSRDDLFERVISWTNGRVIEVSLEA